MPRMIDANCQICDYKIRDQYMQSVPAVMYHEAEGGIQHPMEYVYLPYEKPAEWSDKDAIVVFRDANGQIRYPGRNDVATPPDCERVVLKSLRAAEDFEKRYGVRNEAIWFDRGSGTKRPDDEFVNRMPSEKQRMDSFMKAWRS